jgi:copper chaperone CopZ
MRTIINLFFLFCIVSTSFSQENAPKTMTLLVKGNCDECKQRIENAADIKGVKLCNWDKEKQVATIIYRPDKVTPEQIEKAIAASGHDAGVTKAQSGTYQKLPDCCKYRDKNCEKK